MSNIGRWRDSEAKAVNKYGDTAADRRLIESAKLAAKGKKKVVTKKMPPRPMKTKKADLSTSDKTPFLKKQSTIDKLAKTTSAAGIIARRKKRNQAALKY